MKNIIITTYYLRTIGLSMGNQHSNLLPKSIHDVVDSRTGSIDMLSALLYPLFHREQHNSKQQHISQSRHECAASGFWQS